MKIFRKIQEANKKKIRWFNSNRLHLDPHRWQVMGDSQVTHPNKGIILSKHTQELVDSAKEKINNVLVIGGPGSGRSWHVVLPNLLQMNGSYIVLDHDGTLFMTTKELFRQSGYRVMLLDFWNGPEDRQKDSYIGKGIEEYNYNPFRYLRSDADIDAMIDCMMLNTQKYASTERVVDDSDETLLEKSLLKAFICYILDHIPKERKDPATLIAMLRCGRTQKQQDLETYERNIRRFRQKNPKDRCALAYAPLLEIPINIRLQIMKLVSYRIGLFPQSYLSLIMRPGNTDLECFVEQNTILYIFIPSIGSSLEWYIGTFFTQLTDALKNRTANRVSEHLDRQLNIILNSTPDDIIIPNFHKTLRVWADIGISSMLCARSFEWLQKVYTETWRTIFHTFDTLVYLGTSDLESLPPDLRQYLLAELKSRVTDEQDCFSYKPHKQGRTFDAELIEVLHYVSLQLDQCFIAIKGQRLALDQRYHTQNHPNWKHLHRNV